MNPDNVKKGKKSRKKGTTNQAKSKQYILKHPEIYGIDVEGVNKSGMLQSNRVHSMINSAYPTPFKDLFTKWDIITMPSTHSDRYPDKDERKMLLQYGEVLIDFNYIYLVQVKSRDITQQELLEFNAWKTPFYVRKEIHVWKDGMAEPKIYKL